MNNVYRVPTIDDYLKASAHPLRQSGGHHSAVRQNSKLELPFVSVVTFVRNGRLTIEQTIESVRSQTYPNIEYVVIDGASTDGTVEILRANEYIIDCWISEPDCGATDALNKAIAYSTGDFIFMLPANDWIPQDFIENAVQTLQRSNAEFVFGDVIIYEENAAEFRTLADPNYARHISWRVPKIFPGAAIVRRRVFEKLGLFNLSYKFASDIEWIVRLHTYGVQGIHDSRIVLNFRRGGISDLHYLNGLLDVRRARIEHGFSSTSATLSMLYYSTRYLLKCILHRVLPENAFKQLMCFIRRSYTKSLQPPMPT